MYRTGKRNFLILPPMKTGRGNDFQTVTSLLLFTRMTFFQTYHPKQAIFDGFYTDFKEFSRKISFWEIFAEISHAVRCPSISKKPVEICGGDIRSKSDRQQRGQFLFTVSNAAVSVQKNRHSRRTQITAFLEGVNVKGYIYTPNPFKCRCGRYMSV